MSRAKISLLLTALLMALVVVACGNESGEATPEPSASPEASEMPGQSDTDLESGGLVIYSGRSESLVGPIIERFEEETGIDVKVRYGGTAEMAATILEEGDRSPADIFYAQDPSGLGAVAVQGLFEELPADILERVDPRFRADDGSWVGITGRARVVVYNTDRLSPEDLPSDLWGFTDPQWKGRIGWAPTNGSFQAMVTAMRAIWGEERTREWLEGILANEPTVYENNTSIVAGVGAGEVDVGFVNHYYLYRFLAEQGESFPARNSFLPGGGPGSIVLVSGVGILKNAEHRDTAEEFVRFLLSEEAQTYFAEKTFEYPMNPAVKPYGDLPPLDSLNVPNVDLSNLTDLQGTIELLREVGALP